MSRRALSALLLGLWLALPGGAADPPPERAADSTWYAQAVTTGEGGLSVTHFWSSGPLLRAETVIGGRKIVSLVDRESYLAFDALGGQGLRIARAPGAIAQDAGRLRPFGNELDVLIRQGAEKVRDETLHGALCEVFRVTDQRGRRELWVLKEEPRLPVRLEIFERTRGSKTRTEYINWKIGLPIPQRFFAPHPAIDLQSLSLERYVALTEERGSVGPVPVLYGDLLFGPRKR